jgi:hypothetical protein
MVCKTSDMYLNSTHTGTLFPAYLMLCRHAAFQLQEAVLLVAAQWLAVWGDQEVSPKVLCGNTAIFGGGEKAESEKP